MYMHPWAVIWNANSILFLSYTLAKSKAKWKGKTPN